MAMDQELAHAVGSRIADLMGLTADEDGKYATTWGNKTAAGLARCVERIIQEERQEWPVANV